MWMKFYVIYEYKLSDLNYGCMVVHRRQVEDSEQKGFPNSDDEGP